MRFLVLTIFLSLSGSVLGHFVEQFYVSVETDKRVLLVNFDVGYAMADTRDEVNAPQPQRSWLIGQTDAKHVELRLEAERYLRDNIRFVSSGETVSYEVHFPDFKSNPYGFPKLLNQGAYYNIELKPSLWDGSLAIELVNQKFPKIVLASAVSGETEFNTVDPGSVSNIGIKVTASEQSLSLSRDAVKVSTWQLLILGFQHVIPDGMDHILFILAMCLVAANVKQLLYQSAIFTLAHSVSMALVVSGVLKIYSHSASAYIEPLIALSIALIALEVFWQRNSLSSRYRMIAVFGLIHGLGFAGSLGSALQFVTNGHWLVSLIISNVGIEIAQVILVVITYGVLQSMKRSSKSLDRWGRVVIAGTITLTGVIWFFQRMP